MTGALVALLLLLAAPEEYPSAWFAPLPADVKPFSWEITPDRAAEGEVILSKRTELGVFSNFGATPFALDGVRYGSVEGLWQSLWYPEGPDDPRAALPWKRARAEVAALTGFDAKRAGDDAKKLGAAFMSYRGRRFDPHGSEDDRAFHREVIERATRAKVEQNPDVLALLLRTGDLRLRPDHDQGPRATRAYRYFEILELLRSEHADRVEGKTVAAWAGDAAKLRAFATARAGARRAALRALVALGEAPPAEVVRAALHDPDESVREEALRLLGTQDPGDALVAAASGSAELGPRIARVLLRTAPAAREAIARVCSATDDRAHVGAWSGVVKAWFEEQPEAAHRALAVRVAMAVLVSRVEPAQPEPVRIEAARGLAEHAPRFAEASGYGRVLESLRDDPCEGVRAALHR